MCSKVRGTAYLVVCSKVRGTAYLVGRPALERPVRLAVVGVEDVPVRPLAPAHVARDGRAWVSVRGRARVRARVRLRLIGEFPTLITRWLPLTYP